MLGSARYQQEINFYCDFLFPIIVKRPSLKMDKDLFPLVHFFEMIDNNTKSLSSNQIFNANLS